MAALATACAPTGPVPAGKLGTAEPVPAKPTPVPLYTRGSYGYDISYPQRSGPYPSSTDAMTFNFGVVGVGGGRAFTRNSYLEAQFRWLSHNGVPPSLYMNLNYPVGANASRGKTGPRGDCAQGDEACVAYNYGYNAAGDAYGYATSSAVTAGVWWLDIEPENSWSDDTRLNAQVIQGAIDCLKGRGITVGIYSSNSWWSSIAGDFTPGLASWVAGARSLSEMPDYCTSWHSFAGGEVLLVQFWDGSRDIDYACP
jgi:hypothetical protein